MNGFQQQFNWQRQFIPQVVQILKFNASKLFDISEATEVQDKQFATDLVLRVKGGDIALRLRKNTCKFRDFTIRAINCDYKTERDKIREGFARWYFFGWVDTNNIIAEWILVDIDRFRSSGMVFEDKPLIDNYDGTQFVAYSLDDLFHGRCLLAWELKKEICNV